MLEQDDQTTAASRIQAVLSEALQHERDHDYLSAVFALEEVPEPLRHEPPSGATETVAAVLTRLKSKQMQCVQLDQFISKRVAAGQLNGLLPELDRLLALCPDRQDMHSLKAKLQERHATLIANRDKALTQARRFLTRQDYRSAAVTLKQVDPSVETPDVTRLREQSERKLDRLLELHKAIKAFVADNQFDELPPLIDEYLQLRPGDPEIIKLKKSIATRGEQAAATLKRAQELWSACRFSDAAGLLEQVPKNLLFHEGLERLEACHEMHHSRSAAMLVLDKSLASRPVAEAVLFAKDYQNQLARHSLQDGEFSARIQACAKAVADAAMFRKVLFAVLIAGGTVATLVVVVVAFLLLRSAGSTDTSSASAADAGTPPPKPVATAAAQPSKGSSTSSSRDWYSGARTNSIGMKLIPIGVGKFDRRIYNSFVSPTKSKFMIERVTIDTPFSMGQTEVTQAQWQAVLGTTPWANKPGTMAGPQYPVTHVTLQDAEEFCLRLTEMDRKSGQLSETGCYALPSEHQWEYACKAGTTGMFYFGEEESALGKYEWFSTNTTGAKEPYAHKVALKKPNGWGLYDMSGNVREICTDFVRGGSWVDSSGQCRASRFKILLPGTDNDHTGFRVIFEK